MVLTGQDKPLNSPMTSNAVYLDYYGYAVPGGPLSWFGGSGPFNNSRRASWLFGTVNGQPFLFGGNLGGFRRAPIFGPVFTPFLPVSPVFRFASFSPASVSGHAPPVAGTHPK
jgi:hypothetical protein